MRLIASRNLSGKKKEKGKTKHDRQTVIFSLKERNNQQKTIGKLCVFHFLAEKDQIPGSSRALHIFGHASAGSAAPPWPAPVSERRAWRPRLPGTLSVRGASQKDFPTRGIHVTKEKFFFLVVHTSPQQKSLSRLQNTSCLNHRRFFRFPLWKWWHCYPQAPGIPNPKATTPAMGFHKKTGLCGYVGDRFSAGCLMCPSITPRKLRSKWPKNV